MASRGKKKGTPKGVDELLKHREVIGEDAYRDYWRRLNRARKEGAKEFAREGLAILKELTKVKRIKKVKISPIKGKKLTSKSRAIAAAKRIGGRVVRRDARGRFSKRGGEGK